MMINCISYEAFMQAKPIFKIVGENFASKINLSPTHSIYFSGRPYYAGGSAVVYSLIVVALIAFESLVLGLWFVLQYFVLSGFTIISLWKRELVALILLCSENNVTRCYSSFTLPRDAIGWSVVCDCGITCSYSPTLYKCYFYLYLQRNT